jgi:phosphoserine phosphatase
MTSNQYKVVVFDLDGTLFKRPWNSTDDDVAVSSWDVVFRAINSYDEHEQLKKIFLRGGFRSYIDWTDAACCVLRAKNLDRQTFQKLIDERPFTHGAVETLNILKENNIVIGVVSGSFEALALRVKKELEIDHVLAHCRLIFDDAGHLKDWKLFATDWKDKLKFVRYITQLHKAKLKQCAYVGDDVNDIHVFKKVGLAISFNSTKQKVNEHAHVVIKKEDLREILPHLGIRYSPTD